MKLTKKSLKHQYIELNKTQEECAVLFNCKRNTIRYKLSQYGIKKQKDVDISEKNLKHQYINLNKTIKECAKFFNCKESIIKYKISQFNINKKNNVQITKHDLEREYIIYNKTRKECAKIFNCHEGTIKRYAKKYGLKKDKSKIQENIEKTFLENFGGKAPACLPRIKEKIKQTNIKKGNIKTISKKELEHQYIILGKTKEECAAYFNVGETTITRRLSKFKLKREKKDHHTFININNLEIWINDELFLDWLEKKSNELGRKLLFGDIGNFFNVAASTVSKRLIKLKNTSNKYKYINYHPKSIKEESLATWLLNNNIKFERNNKSIIKPLELDFVIKNKKIAIELNDTETHCIEHKIRNGYSLKDAKNYHNKKSEMAKKRGYRLIHIFEKDLNDLDNILGVLLPTKKINARELTYKHDYFVMDFIIKNHQQHTCSKKYGGALLDKKSNILGAITFKKNRDNLELDKLCFKKGYIIRGGSSKLFKNYLKNIDTSQYNNIITFCDSTYHHCNIYEKLGFKIDKIIDPMYFWVKNDEWIHRRQFQKHLLKEKFNLKDDYVKNHTEMEICNDLGYVSIYTSNQIRYIYKL